jgi:hypothetical protein
MQPMKVSLCIVANQEQQQRKGFDMGKVYKIHPGIGIARVAPSMDGYYIVGETPAAGPFEIDDNGNEKSFKGYKDDSHLLRRQGVRFRVFEYDQPTPDAALIFVREITATAAKIEWSVTLVAAKAAGAVMTSVTGPDGARTLHPGSTLRNAAPAGFTIADLRTEVRLDVTGPNAGPALGTGPKGRIVGADILIGEVRTDAGGRLIVLAGLGVARSWQSPVPDIGNFLNNPTWYDDIADGTVDARITFPGETPINAAGAWVFTTPPDFAPDTAALTSLLDIAEQAAGIPLPPKLTYPQDIEPILKRAAGLFFVNEVPVWQTMDQHLANPAGLNDPTSGAAARRKTVRDDLLKAESLIDSFRMTNRQKSILQRWVDGQFESGTDTSRPVPNAAENLDRSVLARCVGGGFFPGIEAGTTLRQPTIYTDFARLTRGSFTDVDGAARPLQPGMITQRMACPWQADFTECIVNWWPAQRPDITGRTGGAAEPRWDRGIIVGGDPEVNGDPEDPQSHLNMVAHFAQLGVLVKDPATGAIKEVGRDPNLDQIA